VHSCTLCIFATSQEDEYFQHSSELQLVTICGIHLRVQILPLASEIFPVILPKIHQKNANIMTTSFILEMNYASNSMQFTYE
jgi:hypothetical protein